VTVRGVPAAGEFLSVVVFLCNLMFVAACFVAYSRASLASRLGVNEDVPLGEFAFAILDAVFTRGSTSTERNKKNLGKKNEVAAATPDDDEDVP
jgi:hypothetical protein